MLQRCSYHSHAGLHTLGLDIASVHLDGKPAAFHLKPGPSEAWPSDLEQSAAHGLAPELAEYSYCQYGRLLNQEAQPNLLVEPPASADGMDIGSNPALAASVGAMGFETKLSIKYRVKQPRSGLIFHGRYAFTDMQVWTALYPE